ncbi:hypothetical protein KP509_02G071100 [Ceratopteris richardii]|nr:hypothetical protein KP509_02G071100 [Ceratopteris richardii]
MPSKHVSRSKYTFVAALKACVEKKYLDHAQQIHEEVVIQKLDTDLYIANSLISIYSKCGLLHEARKVFQGLLVPSVASWTALIAGYAENGVAEEGFSYFNQMLIEGTCLDAFTFACVLRLFATASSYEMGQRLHSVIATMDECKGDLHVGNALVDMYAKCGKVKAAQKVFSLLGTRDEITWATLLTGLNNQGLGEAAIGLLEEMQVHNVPMNPIAFASSLKACALARSAARGYKVHSEIVTAGYELDQVVSHALIGMYSNLGSLAEAQTIFDRLPAQDPVSWNILMSGYFEHGFDEEVLHCTHKLFFEGTSIDIISYSCSLKACGSLENLNEGYLLHSFIVEEGHDEEVFVGNSLIDMYTRCYAYPEAKHVCSRLLSWTIVTWSLWVATYLAQGFAGKALLALQNLQLHGISPDEVIYLYGLQACGFTEDLSFGRTLHSQIVKHGLDSALAVGNTLIDMYNKCHSLTDAYYLFIQLPSRSPESWGALISGYSENGLYEEALLLMEHIEQDSLPPTAAAFVSSLRACGTVGALEKGQELHCEIIKKGLLSMPIIQPEEDAENNASLLPIASSLIEMYAKCKNLLDAQYVFSTGLTRSIVMWNVLMGGYTRTGEDKAVFYLFDRLNKEGISPNEVTFLSLLTVCSHNGFVKWGVCYYASMLKWYRIIPTIEHHNCIIDLLGRAGQLPYAVKVLEEMPSQPNMPSWNTILAACRKWGNVELARRALECAMRLDQNHAAAFIALYNIYADANMWTDAKTIRAAVKKARSR